MNTILYSIGCLLGASVLVGLAIFGAISTDPEARLNDEQLAFAPVNVSKPILLRAYEREILLLGSSRMMEVDPEAIGAKQTFNGAIGGIAPEGLLELVEGYATSNDIVVISLDLYMMNEINTPLTPGSWARESVRTGPGKMLANVIEVSSNSALGRRVADELNYAMNIGTLVRGLAGQRAGQYSVEGARVPLIYPDGQIFNESKFVVDRVCQREVKPPVCDDSSKNAYLLAWKGHFGEFKYSIERLKYLQKLKQELERRDIKHVVIINPESDEFLPIVTGQRIGRFAAWFQEDVTDIFDNVCNYFESEFSAPENYYATDPFHYKPQAGARMVVQCLEQYGLL